MKLNAVAMALKLFPLISAVLLVCSAACLVTARQEGKTHTDVVCVVEVESSLNVVCQNSVSNCTSLECVAEAMKGLSSIEVLFFTDMLKLSHQVMFDHLRRVRFTGASNGTTVNCSVAMLESDGEAGLSFVHVRDLVMLNMTFVQCGAWQKSTTYLNVSSNTTVPFRSSVYFWNSANIRLVRVNIIASVGNGLTLYDTNGMVEVEHCIFSDNGNRTDSGGGGGVYIEFSHCSPGSNTNSFCNNYRSSITNSRYHFHNCYFSDNKAISLGSDASLHYTEQLFQRMGKGGALCIHIHDGAFNNTFEITNSHFYNNTAVWGGALYLSLHGNVSGNSITVSGSKFIENKIGRKFGGGVSIGYSAVASASPNNNNIVFKKCEFIRNVAAFGGGTGIYATRRTDAECVVRNSIEFINCVWDSNKAKTGSAVDITPHYCDTVQVGQPIATPVFRDCNFSRNVGVPNVHVFPNHPSWLTNSLSRGAFTVTDCFVEFAGTIKFVDNNGSSLYLVSTVASFKSGTESFFGHNEGFNGGAITLIGVSSLQINDNSLFHFKDNNALAKGGAIYFKSIDYHDFMGTRNCFLQYRGKYKPNNITFIFVNNTSGTLRGMSGGGNSIYATSVLPCFYACHSAYTLISPVPSNTFSCIGNFSFLGSSNLMDEIGTATSCFEIDKMPSIVPGKKFLLPFHTFNDYGKEIQDVYLAHIETDNASTIIVENAQSYIFEQTIELYGNPESKGQLSLYEDSLQSVVVSVGIEMEECPPGYIHRGNNLPECVCSYITNVTYMGITGCNSEYRASLSRGYWMGYDQILCGGDSFEREECLLSSYCHSSFCFADSRKHSHLLPEHANAEALDSTVCGPYRTGTLCAKCKQNYSVFYHDNDNFKCSKNTLCHVGWLFYILSELVPLTILFTLVIVFNVTFTSGAVNGFILFAQVYDTLDITAQGRIFVSPDELYLSTQALIFVYKFFNLDFFSSIPMSFCLWSNARSLDVLAFKYVTMAYALTLILIMISIMNFAPLYRVITFVKPRVVRQSVTHGLTAFLIMCYAQCAKVTFQILRPVSLYTRNGTVMHTVPFYYGEIGYFSKEHLPYALPAIVCLISIMSVPPLLLLVYPLVYQILAFLRINESDRLMKIIHCPVSKLKPLLDSFQSCFSDRTRFFAGLYFVYRFLVLATSVFAKDLSQFYTITSGLLILILIFHAVAQPYHVKWHNTVDTLIFGDLAMINCLTLFNFMKVKESKHEHVINTTYSIQLVLAMLPLMYIMVYVVTLLARVLCAKCKKKQSNIAQQDEDELPARLFEDSMHSNESDYHSFHECDSEMGMHSEIKLDFNYR